MKKLYNRLQRLLGLGKIDMYIIRTFLTTFFFCISLIILVAIIFDINEKIDDFIKPEVSLYEIIFHYYISFAPYYANIFSPLFVFISVIFFTTKLAENSEIIAMLASGQSFKRLLKPYFICAFAIACISGALTNFVVPPTNKLRFEFENTYIKNKKKEYAETIHVEVAPETTLFLKNYNARYKSGSAFALESFEGRDIRSRLTARNYSYDTLGRWTLTDYRLRTFEGIREVDKVGEKLDTIIPIDPKDFLITPEDVETMTTPELQEYIKRQEERGIENAKLFSIELHKRYANFFCAFILTFIGAVLSGKKIKNGMGLNLLLGVLLSVGYILFISLTSTFAINGSFPPWLASWLPNIVFVGIGLLLWKKAPQ